MKRALNKLVYPSLLMAWLIIVVGVFVLASQYDFVHVFVIPLELPKLDLFAHLSPPKYLWDLLTAGLGAAVFSTACVGLGLLLTPRRGDPQAGLLATATTAFLAGEIIFSIYLLTCIVLYKLTPLMVAGAIVVSLLAGARGLTGFARSLPRPRMPAAFTPVERVLVFLAIAVMASSLLYSSSVLGYDSVVQYFSQPKLLAAARSAVLSYPRDLFLVSSLHSEILYTGLIQTFGDQAARLLSWLNGLAIMLLGLSIGEQSGLSRRARLWFVCLLLTSTAYFDLLGDGKVELASTAFFLAAIYWLLRAVQSHTRSDFLRMGLFAGFAVIARPYNVLLAPLFLGLFLALHLVRQRRTGPLDLRPYLIGCLWALGPVLLLGGFHLWQNWLWLGNPLAPLSDSARVATNTWQWQFDPRLLNLFRILYPLVATFANSPQSLGNVTPFVVGSLPFLLFRDVRAALRQHAGLLWLALAAMITLIVWLVSYFTVVEIRYVLFLWVLFFLLIAQLIEIVVHRGGFRAGTVVRPLLVLALLYMGVRAVLISIASYSPIDSAGQPHCYHLDFCTFMDPLNETAARGERVFVDNAYRYYLRPDLFACSSRADEYGSLQALAEQGSPDFWVELYRAGFQYVTYESNFSIFHARFGELPAFDHTPPWLDVSVMKASVEGLYGDQLVYEIRAVHPPVQPATYCEPDSAGIWQVRPADPPQD